VLVAGDGARRLAAALQRADLAIAEGHGRPDPVIVARLGAARWQRGVSAPLRPLYLHAPDTTSPRAALATAKP
jgi:hypothetical protein